MLLLWLKGRSSYYFMDDLYGPIYEKVTDEMLGKPGYYKAVHGYSPKKRLTKPRLFLMDLVLKKETKSAMLT